MENGTEIVAEPHVQKEDNDVARVSEERLEEMTVLGSNDRWNETDAEEVFEEAVETHELLTEDSVCAKPNPGDHDVSGEREGANTSDADEAGVEVILNGGDEVEKFEEAIGVSDGVIESGIEEEVMEAVVEEKIEDFVSRVSIDGAAVDDVAVEMEDLKNEVNGTCEEDSVKVISEIVADGERESTNGDKEIDDVSFKVIDNDAYEKDDAENGNTEEVCTIEKLDTGAGSLDSHQASDSIEEISTKDIEDRSTEVAPLAVERNVSAESSLVTEDQIFSNVNVLDSRNLEVCGDKSEDAEEKGAHTEVQVPDDSEPKHSMIHTDITKDSDSGTSENNGETHESKSALGNGKISTEDKEVTLEVVTPTFTEKSTTENHGATGQSGQVRDVHVVSDNGISTSPEKKEETTPVVTRATNLPAQGIAPLPKKPTNTTSSQDKPTNPGSSSARPAGLGHGAHLLEPASRVVQQPRVNGTVSHTQNQTMEEPVNGDPEEYDETREKLQMIRVKFLRLAHRLGQTPHNVVVAQVLYRLGLAEQLRGRNGGRVGAFSFDHASAKAEQLEASGLEPLDFSCTIMVLGKTGVGKSATINSIFDEMKFSTDAFQMGTKKVQDVVGLVQGIKVRVIDTPGLLPSWSDQRQNEKTLQSVKRFISKTPPDIVLYLDRLDMQSRDFSDMPLLRTITETFGPSIWCNAIVVLTHAASAPPDGPNGTASSYDMFVTQRSHVVQQAIRQAAADMRLMNPVSLVENHSACRTNRNGQRVLPNGQVWKPHLLLLSFASKILAEANALLKLQDNPPGKPFAARSRAPPLPYLLSSLLQSRPQLKLPEEQYGGGDDAIEDDLDESSDSDDEAEYDELPPFTPLTKSQVAKLSGAQKKAYFDEVDYRERLFMKKQLKEEKARRRMMKKMAAELKDLPSEYAENPEEENQPSVPMVPMPDLALPALFDSDNPTHRYRSLDSFNKWLVRPVLETHGWDHDIGYEGINVDRLFVVKDKVPLSVSGQVTKDKNNSNLQLEVASSVKHGEGKATSFGFDMQTVGKDLAYTLRSETRFANFRKNKATAGISATFLGDALSGGIKLEDKLIANKRFQLVVTGGAMAGRGEVAYGGSLEAQLRDKDHPFGRSLSTLGLSVMDWHGDLAIGGNVQTQIPVGRNSNLVARANLNNRGSGQISIRLTSSEQLQIALVALVPIIKRLLAYPQQLQYGQ